MVSFASGLPRKCKHNKLECWNIINYICRDMKVLESWKQVVVVTCAVLKCVFFYRLYFVFTLKTYLPFNRDTALSHRLNCCSFGVECFFQSALAPERVGSRPNLSEGPWGWGCMWLFVVFVFTTKAVVIITSEILNTFVYAHVCFSWGECSDIISRPKN